MDFRPTEVSQSRLDSYAGLFQQCFPAATQLNPAYLKWLYADNPAGGVIGFDAWDGETLAAHYVCIPAMAIVNGRPDRVLLSLNTATHPGFQGKGLFTKLAELTYGKGADEGYAAVYGVANANSTPGFLRKLGFTLVSPLDAKVGLGRISGKGGGATADAGCGFKRIWEPATLAWRISNPERRYRLVSCGDATVGAQASTGKIGLVAWAEIPDRAAAGLRVGRGSPALRLHLGLRPSDDRSAGVWFDVPGRLRPSPLNLIFKSLRDGTETLDANRVTLGQLDFDAF